MEMVKGWGLEMVKGWGLGMVKGWGLEKVTGWGLGMVKGWGLGMVTGCGVAAVTALRRLVDLAQLRSGCTRSYSASERYPSSSWAKCRRRIACRP